MKKRFHVKILGQDISVLSDSGDEYVETVVQFVNDKVAEVERLPHKLPSLNVAILTALNIADEYFQIRNSSDDVRRQLENRSAKLINLIEGVG